MRKIEDIDFYLGMSGIMPIFSNTMENHMSMYVFDFPSSFHRQCISIKDVALRKNHFEKYI